MPQALEGLLLSRSFDLAREGHDDAKSDQARHAANESPWCRASIQLLRRREALRLSRDVFQLILKAKVTDTREIQAGGEPGSEVKFPLHNGHDDGESVLAEKDGRAFTVCLAARSKNGSFEKRRQFNHTLAEARHGHGTIVVHVKGLSKLDRLIGLAGTHR